MTNNTMEPQEVVAAGEGDQQQQRQANTNNNTTENNVQPTESQQPQPAQQIVSGEEPLVNGEQQQQQQANENMDVDQGVPQAQADGENPPAVNGNDESPNANEAEQQPAANGNDSDADNGDENAPAAEPFYGFEESEPNLEEKDMPQVLQFWESKHTQPGFDPVPILKRLAEIFEKEKEIYMRKDPDPFDERHPYRTDPSCQFGFLLKQLFRKDIFMKKLVNDYLRDNYFTRQNVEKSSFELNILALRLILGIMPGLETSAVFQVEFDHLINRIYGWAEDSFEPLQSYATGLLAAAMEVTDIAVTFREMNTQLVPKMIKRLHMLQAIYKTILKSNNTNDSINISIESEAGLNNSSTGVERILPSWMADSAPQSPQRLDDSTASARCQNSSTLDTFVNSSNLSTLLENSRDAFPTGSGGRYYKKMYIPIHPPSAETSQMLILRYLTTMGEYQEFLGLIFEHNAMQLIFGYIENLDRRDTCLAFEALKYLASLLCHKKFALDFITHGGLERLLKVPRPSIAATGVSITLYYLAYSEDAMERICTMPKPIITELVKYALWILGHSYDSGKCHATMFFGLSFQFKAMLDEFDAQDGLRKLYNVISVLKILNPSNNDDENNELNEDVECASRQIVRHVCVALKRYMESHLFYKYNNFMCQQFPVSSEYNRNITKATKTTMEQINEQIRNLQENTSVRAHWSPVDQLLKLGGITLLLKIIAFSYDWNNSGRSETVRSALDVLSICCVIPRVYATYCDILELPLTVTTSGIYSILGAAAGDIVPDADVQKSALAVLCNCVCSPIARKEPSTLIKCFGSSRKAKHNNKYSEELVEKVWESVCSNNGIIVLLSLMQIKTPITDADCIRGMACRALAGLARWERVKQIIGKLPLFASGQIQTLMRDPILQEKRTEHVIFQKYALELLEQVSGKAKPFSHQLDPSLANIHKANVIAQTKIQYNEHQLYQLIYDHLESKGLTQTAAMLQKEANIQLPSTTMKSFHQSPFDYKVMPTSSIARNRLRSRMQDVNQAINSATGTGGNNTNSTTATSNCVTSSTNCTASGKDALNDSFSEDQSMTTVTPIKLVKKTEKVAPSLTGTSASNLNSASSSAKSLQKQISVVDPHSMVMDISSPPQFSNNVTLSTIVTEYLTNQHALCNNPMTTCPQFDLLTPHKCPDPKPNRILGDNLNVATRFFRSQDGYNTRRLNRRFIHSHFAPWKTIRSNDYNDVIFSSCHIVPNSDILLAGTHQGDAKVYNMNHGTELFSARCHSYIIDSILSNRTGDLVLTSVSWRSPLSVLWAVKDNDFISKIEFVDEFYCEFSKLSQDKVIGTLMDACTIYDIGTGQKISTFTPTLGNQYTKNRATFCPTDELVLSSGVLWDVRSGKEIHKFDKLNQSLSGVFHPNGLEIISNTEVWDLRTFHLLQTVPVLDQCLIKFSPLNVMYGIRLEMENRSDFDDTTSYDTSFKVLDAYDYTSIATIDAKRSLFDLSVSGNGSLIALVEDQPSYESKPETFVKIYCVGMKKTEQDEEVCDIEIDNATPGNGSSNLRNLSRLHENFGTSGDMGRAIAREDVSGSLGLFVTTAASGNGGVGGHAVPRPRAAGGVNDANAGRDGGGGERGGAGAAAAQDNNLGLGPLRGNRNLLDFNPSRRPLLLQPRSHNHHHHPAHSQPNRANNNHGNNSNNNRDAGLRALPVPAAAAAGAAAALEPARLAGNDNGGGSGRGGNGAAVGNNLNNGLNDDLKMKRSVSPMRTIPIVMTQTMCLILFLMNVVAVDAVPTMLMRMMMIRTMMMMTTTMMMTRMMMMTTTIAMMTMTTTMMMMTTMRVGWTSCKSMILHFISRQIMSHVPHHAACLLSCTSHQKCKSLVESPSSYSVVSQARTVPANCFCCSLIMKIKGPTIVIVSMSYVLERISTISLHKLFVFLKRCFLHRTTTVNISIKTKYR